MDALFELIYVLCHWRFALSLATSIATALVLSSAFAWFTAGYCITLVIFGAAFGIIWQGRGEAGVSLTAEMPSPPISKPVACLSFLFIGALWGSLASYFLHSAIAAASALVASVVSVGLWYRFVLRRPLETSYLAFTTASLLVGYFSLVLVLPANASAHF